MADEPSPALRDEPAFLGSEPGMEGGNAIPQESPQSIADADTLKTSVAKTEPLAGEIKGAVAPDTSPARYSKQSRTRAPSFLAASFPRRLSAALIDLAICIPLGLFLAWIANEMVGIHLPATRATGIDYILSIDYWLDLILTGDPAFLSMMILSFDIFLLYLLLFQMAMSQTLGMRALGIRIINLYGEDIGQWQSALRTIAYVLCLATLNLGFLWTAFDREKRGLHDWIAKTYVVKENG